MGSTSPPTAPPAVSSGRGQLVASLASSVAKDPPAGRRGHLLEEAVNAPAVTLLRLVGPFDGEILLGAVFLIVQLLALLPDVAFRPARRSRAELESIACGPSQSSSISGNGLQTVDCDPRNPLLSLPVEAEPRSSHCPRRSADLAYVSYHVTVAKTDSSAW